jgi:hypothetical protein
MITNGMRRSILKQLVECMQSSDYNIILDLTGVDGVAKE